MSKLKDITGHKFNRLTVVSRAENSKNGKAMWLCKCDCGNTLIVWGSNLRNGHTKSCGCLQKEKTTNRNLVHGKACTNIHSTWKSMTQRCCNPNATSFKYYGARGISVCEEWKRDFQAFYDYVSQLPHFGEEGYSIDRINNNGNYEPGNVKWSTRKEQSSNRRSCKYVYYEGEILTVAELSEKIGVSAKTLYSKIHRKEKKLKDARAVNV